MGTRTGGLGWKNSDAFGCALGPASRTVTGGGVHGVRGQKRQVSLQQLVRLRIGAEKAQSWCDAVKRIEGYDRRI